MADLSIARAFEPSVVDLWGTEFETVDATRSVVKKITALQTKVAEQEVKVASLAEGSDVGDMLDDLVDVLTEAIDCVLRPIGNARKKPSSLIKAKWDADEITLDRIQSFLTEVSSLRGDGSGKGQPA